MKFDKLLMRLALAECRLAGAPADRVDVAAALVADRLRVVERQGHAVVRVVDDKGTPRIADVLGNDLDVSSWVAEAAKANPLLFRPTPEAPSTGTPPEKATTTPTTAEAVRQKREQDASDDRAEAARRLSWVNPWIKGQENLTHQMVLLNREPDRAARFKVAAGVRD